MKITQGLESNFPLNTDGDSPNAKSWMEKSTEEPANSINRAANDLGPSLGTTGHAKQLGEDS